MQLGLTAKVALITGGTSGIGLAIAQTLAAEGCSVAVCGRDRARLDKAVAAIKSPNTKGFVADICKPGDIAGLVDNVSKAFGGVDIVVSNAGTHLPGRLDEIESDALQHHFQTKVIGAWELARRVAPVMKQRGGGRFIVIIGQAGKVPQANAIASTVINAAEHAFVKSLSDDLAPHGILVNAVCPGYTDTDLVRAAVANISAKTGRDAQAALAELTSHNPQGRLVTPEEVADTVRWLCLRSSASVTGQSIAVAGGEVM
jgi:NAD(P)-dependent dehydrogenase (short-subunit alcohol dehydrogenase family)